jgi:hypothetical protein
MADVFMNRSYEAVAGPIIVFVEKIEESEGYSNCGLLDCHNLM